MASMRWTSSEGLFHDEPDQQVLPLVASKRDQTYPNACKTQPSVLRTSCAHSYVGRPASFKTMKLLSAEALRVLSVHFPYTPLPTIQQGAILSSFSSKNSSCNKSARGYLVPILLVKSNANSRGLSYYIFLDESNSNLCQFNFHSRNAITASSAANELTRIGCVVERKRQSAAAKRQQIGFAGAQRRKERQKRASVVVRHQSTESAPRQKEYPASRNMSSYTPLLKCWVQPRPKHQPCLESGTHHSDLSF
jgi:hypothetical protein